MSRVVSVAVPIPSLDLLTYSVPDVLDVPSPGARVLVPLGTRIVTGCVVRAGAEAASGSGSNARGEIKDVIDVLDEGPFVPAEVLDLALWTAEYYIAGPGEAIAAAMPPRAWVESARRAQITGRGREALAAEAPRSRRRRAADARRMVLEWLAAGRATALDALTARARRDARLSPGARPIPVRAALRILERDGLVTLSQTVGARRSGFKTVRVAALTAEGHDLARDTDAAADGKAQGDEARLGMRQRDVLNILRGAPEGLRLPALGERGVSADTLRRLAARGLITLGRERVERDPFAGEAVGDSRWSLPDDGPRTLTDEQVLALERLSHLVAARAFRVALLHGVTGSGKTEIYIRLAREVRAAGRRVLLLVPEIALTPAVGSAFRSAFGDRVAIQHSGLSDGERHDQWQRIRRGEIDLVIGTRSAVFAPLADVGLIIVDEEHDSSYKQEESPRYNGRDVAIVRAQRARALVILGSATPSMESSFNALSGRYERIALERRVLDRPLASVRIVNMREEYAARGPEAIVSEALREAIGDRLARHEQVLVLLNRRGFATAVFCRQCGATLECPNCSVSLTVHTIGRGDRRARCHYCNYSMRVPKACAQCAAPYLEQVGFGTERVEAELAALFPGIRLARVDRDTSRRRGAVASILGRFGRGELDALVGTQMIAKGHDFPDVTLVGVISADVGLGLADFRAAERTFQLLTQVAGRAGRGEKAGEAVVQTLYPEHYSIRHACRQNYEAFFEDEIRFRRAMRYPPIVSLINAIVRAPSFGQAMEEAGEIVRRLRSGGAERHARVLGPAPAPLVRLRGEHRAQLFLKGTRRAAMREALKAALAASPELKRRVTIDVDPLSVL